jgi:hypothetical protein
VTNLATSSTSLFSWLDLDLDRDLVFDAGELVEPDA